MVLRVKHASRERKLVQTHVLERVLAAGYVSAPGLGRSTAGWTPSPASAACPGAHRTNSSRATTPLTPSHRTRGSPSRAPASTRSQAGAATSARSPARGTRGGTSVRKAARITRVYLSFGGAGAPTAVGIRRLMAGNHRHVAFLLDPSRTT